MTLQMALDDSSFYLRLKLIKQKQRRLPKGEKMFLEQKPLTFKKTPGGKTLKNSEEV